MIREVMPAYSTTISPALITELEDVLKRFLTALYPPAPPKMTYEEFIDWADEDTLAEWVAKPGAEKGEVVMYCPASSRHQSLVGFLGAVLRLFVEMKKSGLIYTASFQMKLPTSGREPDLLFVAAEHLGQVKKTYLDGPADLAVEIISPESAARDRGDKFYEYARGGVPEYWLIDYETEWAEFYQLHGQRYHLVMEGREGKYTSAILPGFWLNIEWLWQDPLPPVFDIARALGLIK